MLTVRSCARARALWVRSPFDECNVWGYAVLPEVDISCRTCSHADQIIRLLSPQPTWSSRLRWRLIFTTGMVCSSPEDTHASFRPAGMEWSKLHCSGKVVPTYRRARRAVRRRATRGSACGHGGRSPVSGIGGESSEFMRAYTRQTDQGSPIILTLRGSRVTPLLTGDGCRLGSCGGWARSRCKCRGVLRFAVGGDRRMCMRSQLQSVSVVLNISVVLK